MILSLSALKEERQVLRKTFGLKPSGTLSGIELDTCPGWAHLCFGMGAERLERALELGLKTFSPRLLLLTGFSVGLSSDLRVGDCFCDLQSSEDILTSLREFKSVPFSFAKTYECGFLSSSNEKKAFAEKHPQAQLADLETDRFFEIVHHGVPVLVIRVVSDELQTDLPLKFEEFMDEKGFPDVKALAVQILLRPSLLPKLVKLGRDAGLAGSRLADSLVFLKPLLSRYQN